MNQDSNYFFNIVVDWFHICFFFYFFLKAASDFGKINIDFYPKRNVCHYVCEKYSEDKFLTRK